MKLYCLTSGSKGNCYLLESNTGRQIILDAGIKLKDICTNPAFINWRNISAALITHIHNDHSKGLKDIARNGINCFGYFNLSNRQIFDVEGFKIMAFECKHDVYCLGFVIKDLATNEMLVYATDTAELPIVLNANYWLVECNYDEKTIDKQIQNDDADFGYLGRVFEAHMGLEYLTEYFKDERIKRPDAIILCHLSENNILPSKAITALNKYSNTVDFAKAGKKWNL
jgi:phosphoribosyl 1,2-cyclic phosphodiesterase